MPIDFRSLLTFCAFVLIGAPLLYLTATGLMQARLVVQRRRRLSPAFTGPAPARESVKGRMWDELVRLGHRIAPRDPKDLSAIRAQLIQAGWFGREAVTAYLGGRFAALALAVTGALLFLPWAVSHGGGPGATILSAVLALAALIGPDRFVAMRRSARIIEYREGLPDLLDLLVASVEAGLSLDAAVNRVGDELVRRYPVLAEHLRYLTLELRAGRDRKDAWQNFAERLGLEEAKAFATMLRQAEEMGTSLGETLRVFSEDMRAKRMLRAEEKAMALSAKLIVPLILFIFPCLLGVLMLPAVFRAVRTMGGG